MDLAAFLGELSVDELKDLAWQLDLLRGGNKGELLERIRPAVSNPFMVLPLLNNDTLKAFCRGSGLRISGTKDELVASLIGARVLEGEPSDLCDFIAGGGLPDLDLALDLVKMVLDPSCVPKVAGLLRHCSDRQIKTLTRQMVKMDSDATRTALVGLVREGSKEEIRSAVVALEVSMELAGQSDPVHRALAAHREGLRARRRKIESAVGRSWKAAPQVHETLVSLWRVEAKPDRAAKAVESKVDRLASKVEELQRRDARKEEAEGERHMRVEAGLTDLKDSTAQIKAKVDRLDTKALAQRLEDSPSREDVTGGFDSVQAATARIEKKVDRIDTKALEEGLAGTPRREEVAGGFRDVHAATGRIEAGLSQVSAEMVSIRRAVEASPQRVADALQQLASSKDIKWTKRQKIKRDLARFSKLVDAAQKAEFLTRVIREYGPMVIAALSTLLKGSG